MQVTISENKLTKKSFTGLKFKQIQCNPSDLVQFIKDGRVFSYNQSETSFSHKGHSYRNSFVDTQLIIVDIDKVDIANDDMVDMLNKQQYRPYLVHTTYSNRTDRKDNKYCYHIIYVFNDVITGAQAFQDVYNTITNEYSHLVDKNADDCHRIMYSSHATLPNFFLHVFGNILDSKELDIIPSNPSSYIRVEAKTKQTQNKPLEGLSKEFLEDLSSDRKEFVKTHRYGFKRESDVLYDDYGFADLTNQEYFKVFDKRFFRDGKMTVKRVCCGKRTHQILVDGFNFLKCNPSMTLELLVSALITEVYYFYDNSDGELTDYKIVEIAKYCMSNQNEVSKQKRKFKIDTAYFKENYNVRGIKAVSIAKKVHNDTKIVQVLDVNATVEENAKNAGVTVDRMKKFVNENGLTVKTSKDVEEERILSMFDASLSIRENAKLIGTNPSKIHRLIKEFHLK